MKRLTVFIILATILLLALSGCKSSHARVVVSSHHNHHVGCIHYRPVVVHRPIVIHRPQPSIIIHSRISHSRPTIKTHGKPFGGRSFSGRPSGGRPSFGRGVRGGAQNHLRSAGRSRR